MFDTPGVYVREIPSGSRPISGVSTSNTAFIGVFERGPLNKATRVTSFGQFQREFGGLFAKSDTSYAVRSYFLNGGSVAFIVRVASGAVFATENLQDDSTAVMTINASSAGSWGDNIYIAIAHSGEDGTTFFTMLVREYEGEQVIREEAFIDVSITEGDPRYINAVIEEQSELISIASHNSGGLPNQTVTGAVTATTLDDLLEAPLTGFTSLDQGDDGVLPADSDAWTAVAQSIIVGSEADGSGIYALDRIVPEVFNILCLPDAAVMGNARFAQIAPIYEEAYVYCRNNFAFLLVDIPDGVTRDNLNTWVGALGNAAGSNSAIYYPRIEGADPLNPLKQHNMPTSGIVAGQFARTDTTRGVWKAPAGTETSIVGGQPTDIMTDRQQGPLNTQGINVLRTFPVYNSIVWGARTLHGADARASEWKYTPVRRLALFIESSLQQGLKWAVFEPNDEPLWGSIRLNIKAFMGQLYRQGAFQGSSAKDAFLVKCDSETTTQADINLGILNIYVGFAPVRPAEFVMLQIQQRIQTAT